MTNGRAWLPTQRTHHTQPDQKKRPPFVPEIDSRMIIAESTTPACLWINCNETVILVKEQNPLVIALHERHRSLMEFSE